MATGNDEPSVGADDLPQGHWLHRPLILRGVSLALRVPPTPAAITAASGRMKPAAITSVGADDSVRPLCVAVPLPGRTGSSSPTEYRDHPQPPDLSALRQPANGPPGASDGPRGTSGCRNQCPWGRRRPLRRTQQPGGNTVGAIHESPVSGGDFPPGSDKRRPVSKPTVGRDLCVPPTPAAMTARAGIIEPQKKEAGLTARLLSAILSSCVDPGSASFTPPVCGG